MREEASQDGLFGNSAIADDLGQTERLVFKRRQVKPSSLLRMQRTDWGSTKRDKKQGPGDAGATRARAHRLGLTTQGASALSIYGKDTHTLTAENHTPPVISGGDSIIWEYEQS